MKKIFFILFLSSTIVASAQDTIDNTGTIRIQKTSNLHSVLYDNVNFRLICRDVHGNLIDSAVISFKVNVTIKGVAYSEKVTGNTLSSSLQQKLGRMDGIVILMFSDIVARDKKGRNISFPPFKIQSGIVRERSDY
ncbi:MAG TPA: hypothetical protein VF868_01590 [Bacteroidia bacterium]|jgi:hypothetical protein